MKSLLLKKVRKYYSYHFLNNGTVVTRNKANFGVREFTNINAFIHWVAFGGNSLVPGSMATKWARRKVALSDIKHNS